MALRHQARDVVLHLRLHRTFHSLPGVCRSPVARTSRRSLLRLDPRHGHAHGQRRLVHVETLLLPPVVFTGLLAALWVFKCTMMVVFQNKIIYMPGLPPNARHERIEDYASECGGVQWHEKRTSAADGTELGLAVASLDSAGRRTSSSISLGAGMPAQHLYILYLQGS